MEGKRSISNVPKPLLFSNGNNQFAIFARDVNYLAAFKAMLFQPFAAKADDGKKYILTTFPCKAFIANGHLSYFGRCSRLFLCCHSFFLMLQSKIQRSPYPTWYACILRGNTYKLLVFY